jgi:2-C-methyl-D-erythritol 4-phosphate cytidylyltransferase
MNLTQERVHQLFPAAGVGQRFGQPHPKQYTLLAGKTLLEWTLDAWNDVPFDGERLLVLSCDDERGRKLALGYPGLRCVTGGAERADSVLAGLAELEADADDWVMVHDIARPCVRQDDIIALLAHCRMTGQGALLARPLTDTIKRSHGGRVSTVERSELWAAMTPQCFRYGQLRKALTFGREQAVNLTDEASAIEWLGEPVGLVVGSADNIKLTHPDDLGLVTYYLTKQGRLCAS